MNAGAAGGLADFTKAIDQIKEDLGMGLAPALGVGAAALSELVRVGHGAADWAADFAYGIDRAAERMHAAEQGARDLAKGIREAEQAADAAFNKEEADRFDAILGGDGAGRAPFDALAEKYRQQTRTAAAPDAMAGREAAALAQYENELKRIDAMLDKVRADGKPVTSEMQRAADAARDAAEALANVKLSDVNADRAQALADGLAKAADEARRAQQAIDDSIASLRGMERGAEIDLAKAMGLDEKAGGMEIDAWLEDKLAGIDQFIADRVGSGAGMSIDEDEQLAALRAKYEEIARLRKDELGDGGAKELSYRAASLREIGLAAAGKLGAPPAAEHDEEADAAKATADNTEKMVDLLEEIDFGGKWK